MKFAFVVQPDWLINHFGVRNLFMACAHVLMDYGEQVDFVFYIQHGTNMTFYRHIIGHDEFLGNVTKTIKNTNNTFDYKKHKEQNISYTRQQYLGTDISDLYDVIFFTNPWLIQNNLNIKTKKQILLCHDVVANKLALIQDDVQHWGWLHNDGYLFAKNRNMHFLSNSSKTDAEMVKYYHPKKHSVLPPLRPYGMFDVVYDDTNNKRNNIILAAPFDLRKGLKNIPDLLTPVANDIDTLYIFGKPRCTKNDFDEFFQKTKNIKNIEYYPEITNSELIKLYKQSKILLFPSLEEGLGIPLLEAQICGCRVITTNAEPMNKLTLDGGYLLTADKEKDMLYIKKMLKQPFDFNNLSKKANIAFSNEVVYNHIKSILA